LQVSFFVKKFGVNHDFSGNKTMLPQLDCLLPEQNSDPGKPVELFLGVWR